MKFREATKEDFDFVADHSVSRGKVHPDHIDYVYTLEHNGQPLCIGGFKMLNYDTAWCWVDITDVAGNHTIAMYRVIRDWIDSFIAEHDLTRVQATVECDFTEAIRMVKHLGFHKESIMKKYVNNRDAFMYVRMRGE
jgi:RimJ/RimL family protein N-acetyltransferase